MTAIRDVEGLRAAILAAYADLSPPLQQMAQAVLDDPQSLGYETLAVISERVGVPPSAIVRFAKTFGFEGAASMQRLLKDGVLASHSASLTVSTAGSAPQARPRDPARLEAEAHGPYGLMQALTAASSQALDVLFETISEAQFVRAVDLISAAETVYVVGLREAFPVAASLAYGLQMSGKRTVFVDGLGGMAQQQATHIGPHDLMIGISLAPHAPETLELLEAATEAGAQVMVITDTVVNAVAKTATCLLQVRETKVKGLRALAAPLCLVQSLSLALTVSRQEPAL